MRYYELSFFCDEPALPRAKTGGPKCSVDVRKDTTEPWPLTLRVGETTTHHNHPCVTFHMTLEQWAEFKNSVDECDRQLVPHILGREHYE